MRMLMKAAVITAVAASAALSVSGVAMADPQNSGGTAVVPAVTDVVGVGSDTTEFPLDQLMIDYNASHTTGAKLYSWDATQPGTGVVGDPIVTKSGAASIARPNG